MLCDDCGMGKTATAIAMMANIHSSAPEYKHLVVVKKSIKTQWTLEFSRWSKLSTLTLPNDPTEVV